MATAPLRILVSSLLLGLALAAPAHATTAPFPIPDLGLEAIGPGPGNGARLAIAGLEYRGPTKDPRILPLTCWTILAGHRHPTRRLFTRATINDDGAITFVPGGTLLAHAETVVTKGKKGAQVFMADLTVAGKLRSDTPISDPAQRGASPKGDPLVGADGTVAQLYGATAGDTIVPEWLALHPSGQTAWTKPSALPVGEYRQAVRLGPDGSGVVISSPLDETTNAVLISRFGRDGQLAPPISVDLTGTRVPSGSTSLNFDATITDSGTVVIALSVPALDRSAVGTHLLLITLAAGTTTPVVQDVGPSASQNGDQGTLAVQTSGGDTATVLAGGTPGSFRVFDAQAAATASWAPSTITAPTGFDGDLLRLHGGGLAAVWAAGGKRGAIYGTERAVGTPTFATPTPISTSKHAHGDVELLGTALLADDEVFVTYERYGSRSEGDGAFALIGRP